MGPLASRPGLMVGGLKEVVPVTEIAVYPTVPGVGFDFAFLIILFSAAEVSFLAFFLPPLVGCISLRV